MKANIEVGDRPVNLYFVPLKRTFFLDPFKCALGTEPHVALSCIYMMSISITLLLIRPIKS
jgi:hypothetical protein